MRKNIYRIIIVLLIVSASTVIIYFTVNHQPEKAGGRVKIADNYDTGLIYRKPATAYAPAGHIICMLGMGKSLQAISAGMLRDRLLLKYFPYIKKLPPIKSGGGINYEEMLKSGADIVFVSPEVATDERAVKKLKVTGVDFAVISFNSMEKQIETVKKIGKILGREDVSREYENFYREIVNLASERLSGLDHGKRKKIYYSVLEVNRTHGKKSLGFDWLNAAGVVNFSEKNMGPVSSNKYFISIEQILSWNPEIIFANETESVDKFNQSKKFTSIEAVKKKKIFKMPNGISRWGHSTSLETPLALLWTSMNVYPEKYNGIKISYYMKEFYKKFFNIKMDKKLISKILSGKGLRHGKHSRKHRRH